MRHAAHQLIEENQIRACQSACHHLPGSLPLDLGPIQGVDRIETLLTSLLTSTCVSSLDIDMGVKVALIVLMEDDTATRTLVASLLKKSGHEVLSTDNGADGLLMVRSRQPDLVLSDIQMPIMDGFTMLQALRADPVVSTIPVILMTSLQDRAHMRIGMTSGADDYITKPFRPGEVREAVAAQLNRSEVRAAAQAMVVDEAVSAALEVQKHQLTLLYEKRLGVEFNEKWSAAEAGNEDEKFAKATVLYVDVLNYAAFSEILSHESLGEIVRRFYNNVGDTVYLFGAHHMQFVGQAMLAVFVDRTDTPSVSHGLRAVRAALGMVDAARRVQRYLVTRFPDQALPPFDVSVVLHSGAVSLAKLEDPLHGGVLILPVGDTVNSTLLLQKETRNAGWKVVASAPMLRVVAGAVEIGRRALITLPGRAQPIDAAELLSLTV